MNRVRNTAIICGVVSMVATIAFYLLAFEDLFNKPNGWLPLLLLLVAELVGIVKVFAAASSAVCHMDKISKLDRKTKKKQFYIPCVIKKSVVFKKSRIFFVNLLTKLL